MDVGEREINFTKIGEKEIAVIPTSREGIALSKISYPYPQKALEHTHDSCGRYSQ
jgi:hypothetical protein